MKICDSIVEMRVQSGLRRMQLNNAWARSSSCLARRERKRLGKLTSLKMIRRRITGKWLREEEEDLEKLDWMMAENNHDKERALQCLSWAMLYMDDVNSDVRPFTLREKVLRRDWSWTLGAFLAELRTVVSYRTHPGPVTGNIVDLLIFRLRKLRSYETSGLQTAVRFKLEEVMDILFEVPGPPLEVVRSRLFGC